MSSPTTSLTAPATPGTAPGRGGSGRGPARPNPADRVQLERHPVSLRRIAALFASTWPNRSWCAASSTTPCPTGTSPC
jgi:hypothetical protein